MWGFEWQTGAGSWGVVAAGVGARVGNWADNGYRQGNGGIGLSLLAGLN